MTASRPALERRLLAAVDATPSRIPVVLGDFRTGRTQLLCRLRDRIGRTNCQQIDVERSATTPERFHHAIVKASPFRVPPRAEPASARDAFDATLAFLDQARAGGGNEPATFLLDEVLELRTFESFPGLRTAIRDLLKTLSTSPNRFILTTRYVSRAHRLLRDATSRFEVVHVPPLSSAEVRDLMLSIDGGQTMLRDEAGADSLARAVHTLSDGRVGYAQAIGETLSSMVDAQGVGDPVSALTSLLVTRRPSRRRVRDVLRASPSSRAWLRCAESDPRNPRAGRAAHAHRSCAAAQANAGLDERLSVVARRRRPDRVAAQAVQFWRSAAARLGEALLPAVESVGRRSRARSAVVRAQSPAATGARDGGRRRRRERDHRRRAQALGDHRNRLSQP